MEGRTEECWKHTNLCWISMESFWWMRILAKLHDLKITEKGSTILTGNGEKIIIINNNSDNNSDNNIHNNSDYNSDNYSNVVY